MRTEERKERYRSDLLSIQRERKRKKKANMGTTGPSVESPVLPHLVELASNTLSKLDEFESAMPSVPITMVGYTGGGTQARAAGER